MTRNPYPQPCEDADNRNFLSAWRNGELHIQQCDSCGKQFFYPRPICPHCWSDALSVRKSCGRGTIVSYSLVHRPNDPAFNDEVPIVLVEVALNGGALLLGRVVDCDPTDVWSGRAVELPPAAICAKYPLPVFHLAKGQQ